MKRRFSADDVARLWIAVGKVCPFTERARWVNPLIQVLPGCGREVLEAGWCVLVTAGERQVVADMEERVGRERAHELMCRLACDADPRTRLAVVEWAGNRVPVDAGEFVVRALSDPDGKVARAGDEAVRRAVEVALADRESSSVVGTLLEAAAFEFELHQSREVAAGVLALRGSEFGVEGAWARLARDEQGRQALTRAMRSGSHGVIRARAWESVGVPWLTNASIDRLRQPCGPEEHARVLERSHLVRSARRLGTLRSLSARDQSTLHGQLVPMNAAVLARLGERGCVGVGRMLLGLSADVGFRERWGRAALGHPSAGVRYAAWRATPRRTAVDYAFDRESSIARAAALAASGEPGPWRALARSEHASVRAIAGEELCRFGECWIERADAILGLKRRAAREPATLERDWRRRWEAARTIDRVTLVKLAFRIGMGLRVADVVRIAIDPQASDGTDAARLTATAVVCLRDESVARQCLRAADARVRSNAVEALDAANPSVLIELKADPHHRVRATVLRRLARAGTLSGSAIVREVEAMLERESQAERLAGAWLLSRVAGEIGSGEGAVMIKRSIARERDGRVRERLVEAAFRMERATGAMLADRGVDMEAA